MRRAFIAILALAISCGSALAVQPDEVLSDSALEARARELSKELRCMVCQNQSIDDSDAPLARDLRLLVRERLVAGDNNSEVIEFLVARYGEFVLLRPRLAWHTLILWLAPLAAVIAGALAIIVALRRRARIMRAEPAAAPLTPEEEQRLRSLLHSDATG